MLTLCMAVYGQPKMLAKQLATIDAYPEVVRENLTVIVVDDHGDPPVDSDWFIPTCFHFDSKLFRIDDDIPWNQMGARNLAMQHAKGWCLMVDPDMVFSGEIMERMLEATYKLQRGQVVKYVLKHKSNGKLDNSSPNTYLIHRDDFFAVGGYDEDFAGHKGWSDVQLLDVLRACYKMQERPDLYADFYGVEQVSDAMVTSLSRNTSKNRKIRLKKVAQSKAARGWANWAKTRRDVDRLRFKWRQLV